MNPTKDLELRFFSEFRRFAPELTFTHIEQPEPPAPDILAQWETVRVGVEIVQYLRQSEKKRESEEELVTKEAGRRYRETGGPTVGVSTHWLTHMSRSRSERHVVADALASFVAQNVPPLGTWRELDWTSLPESLAATVHSITIDRVINYSSSDWRVPHAGFFPEVSAENVRELIVEKELRFDGYLRSCNEVWLLIVSEGSGPSSWCEMPEATRCETYLTRFNRVLFLGSNPRTITRLTVRRP